MLADSYEMTALLLSKNADPNPRATVGIFYLLCKCTYNVESYSTPFTTHSRACFKCFLEAKEFVGRRDHCSVPLETFSPCMLTLILFAYELGWKYGVY